MKGLQLKTSLICSSNPAVYILFHIISSSCYYDDQLLGDRGFPASKNRLALTSVTKIARTKHGVFEGRFKLEFPVVWSHFFALNDLHMPEGHSRQNLVINLITEVRGNLIITS